MTIPGAGLSIAGVYGRRTTAVTSIGQDWVQCADTDAALRCEEEPVSWQLKLLLMVAPVALGSAHAHHGWSEYDSTSVLTLTGVIKQSGYEHPHGHVMLDAGGKLWHVVLAPPSRMENRGLPAAALRAGNNVTVVAYPNRTKPDEARAERIIINGKTVELR